MKPKPDDPKKFDQLFADYNKDALARLRKAGDRLPGFSLFFVGVFAVAGAVCVLLFQLAFWLKEGHWLALPISDLLLKVGVSIEKMAHAVEWQSVAKIITWIGDVPSALIVFLVGVLFICFGRE